MEILNQNSTNATLIISAFVLLISSFHFYSVYKTRIVEGKTVLILILNLFLLLGPQLTIESGYVQTDDVSDLYRAGFGTFREVEDTIYSFEKLYFTSRFDSD